MAVEIGGRNIVNMAVYILCAYPTDSHVGVEDAIKEEEGRGEGEEEGETPEASETEMEEIVGELAAMRKEIRMTLKGIKNLTALFTECD